MKFSMEIQPPQNNFRIWIKQLQQNHRSETKEANQNWVIDQAAGSAWALSSWWFMK